MLLRKSVYPYEYMDNWEKVNETTLPKKAKFHRNLNMEEIYRCRLHAWKNSLQRF